MCEETKKFRRLKQLKDLEFVNFGTGMGYYDFCYEDVDVKAFNFSMLQQNLYFDYQLLKQYSDRLGKNCVVCLVLPYFIFCADQLEEVRQRYGRYYALLPKEIVQPYCSISYEEWGCVKNRVKSGDDSLKYPLSREEMELQTEDAIRNWKRELQFSSFHSGIVTPGIRHEMGNTRKWFKKILEYCREKEFSPVALVPPMSQTLLDRIGGEFRKTHYYDILDEVAGTKIPILDYSRDFYFCNPRLYGWPGFLIEEAAKEFTRDVMRRLGMDKKTKER